MCQIYIFFVNILNFKSLLDELFAFGYKYMKYFEI